MTTIALKDGVIAYDSRLSQNDTILSDNFNKMFVASGRTYFISGDASPIECYEQALDANGMKTDFEWLEGSMFVVDSESQIHMCFIMDGQLTAKIACSSKDVCAIGSGSDHALTAMDMGGSATKAVEMAKLRDVNTGGHVRTYCLKEYLDNDR